MFIQQGYVTMKTGVMAAENSTLTSQEYITVRYNKIENSFIKL